MRGWSPLITGVAPARRPEALSDVRPLLERMVTAFNAADVGRLLDVDRAMVTRWRRGAPISTELTHRIADLHDVLSRALRIMHPDTVMHWLAGNNNFLGGARPMDVLALSGAAPVLEALAGFEDLGYA